MELIRCLRAIREHAFDVSDYPVVVTLEDHLTPKLQAKVAEVWRLFGISVTTFYLALVITWFNDIEMLYCSRWLQIYSEKCCLLLFPGNV